MPDNQTTKGNARRKLLKGIAAGSGAVIAGKNLPDSWSRPVVDTVMLPAHAQTSMMRFTGSSNEQGSITPDSQFVRAIDGLVSEAHAGDVIEERPMLSAETCIQQNGDGTVSVDCIFYDGYEVFKLNAPSVVVGGAPVEMSGDFCDREAMEKLPPQTLLDRIGLIPDAHAGGIKPGFVLVRIDSIDGRALGDYLVYGGETSPRN